MKKKKINLDQVMKQMFDLYPDAKKLYFTSDGNCFLDRSPALDHSNKAKVELKVVENEVFVKEAEAAKALEVAKALEAAKESLKSWSEEDADYHKSYDLATDLNLSLENKKKETVYAALKDAQAKLNENK